MNIMNNNQFSYHITKYFSEYLSSVKGVSNKTIQSYRDTFVIFLDYIHEVYKLNINKLSIHDIDEIIIEKFLECLENNRKNSISTRNQRLAALHSFYRYLQKRELSCYDLCSRILSIPNKKTPTKTISYFSVDEITKLINMPNTKTKDGFRDYTLLLFMYETAARAQEVADLKVNQLILGENSSVILTGKGNKSRRIPITNELSQTLDKYIKTFHITEDEIIFKNRRNEKLTTKGIEYILYKYIKNCKATYPKQFKNHYSNHSMRHSRAMHLLESGINLIYIRDILGHSSVVTTEIYAKTNAIIKEKQIREHSKNLQVKERYSENQKADLLKYLKNLK